MRAMGVRIRQWKGAWWVFIAHQGTRKAKRIGAGEAGKKAAKQVAQQIQARLALGQVALPERETITLAEYAETWLDHVGQIRKHTTHDDYKKRLDRWILPAIGAFLLTDITRDKVRAMVTDQLNQGLSPKTASNNVRALSSLLSQAMEDGLIPVNVALKPGKFLPKVSKRRQVNPFTREEVSIFLAAVQRYAPRYYPLFLCAVRTGLRLGELLALQWGDLDFRGRFLLVQRNYTHRKVTTPKSGESRRVDMSRELAQVLTDLRVERQLQTSANGWPSIPEWVFCSETGGLLDGDNLRHRAFYALLRVSGQRKIRFHDLRHTFASLLLQQGESPVYVKEQMGHSSIAITVDLYGHLIPGGNRQAVDRLDEPVKQAWDGVGSATPAQPEAQGQSVGTGNSLNYWCARQESNLRPTGSKSQSDESETQKTAENVGNDDAEQ